VLSVIVFIGSIEYADNPVTREPAPDRA